MAEQEKINDNSIEIKTAEQVDGGNIKDAEKALAKLKNRKLDKTGEFIVVLNDRWDDSQKILDVLTNELNPDKEKMIEAINAEKNKGVEIEVG